MFIANRPWRGGAELPPWADRLIAALKPYGVAAALSLKVIHALLLRESKTRYGRRSAGYIWALISPMILLTVMMTIFTFLGRPAGAGDSMAIFFLTAIIPIRLWRSAVVRGGSAIAANRGLMRYPQVNAFEVITARSLLECLTSFIVLIMFVLILFAFFQTPFTSWVDHPLSIIGASLTLFVLCYGSCFLSSQIGRMFEPWNEFTGPFGRIVLFTSGLWFTLGSLPPHLRDLVAYNPLAHIIEWMRHGVIRDFDSTLFDPVYPLVFGLVCLFIGMFIDWLYRISGYDLES